MPPRITSRTLWLDRLAAAIPVIVVSSAVVEPLFHRGTLIDHIPVTWTGVGLALGIVIGVLIGTLIARNNNELSQINLEAAIIGIAILGGVGGSYYARALFEWLSFREGSSRIASVEFRVVSASNGIRLSGPWVDLVEGEGSRKISVHATTALVNRLQPLRIPGRDCVSLPVETARNGMRRTMLPSVFNDPLGVDRWVQCKGFSLEEAERSCIEDGGIWQAGRCVR